ncbi:hypothetical protein SLS56_001775 [Neofusicoccum ribis]|uniref:Pentatricopeptide repeat protein n=1 Tax=Neofusicoccum ribis TaxID=45134 RepID=A0ABR3T773_9PEZI
MQRQRSYATQIKQRHDSVDGQVEGKAADSSKEYYRSGAFNRRHEVPYYKSKLRKEINEEVKESVVNPGHGDLSPTVKRRLQKELEWFGSDPLKLADTVKKRLSNGDDTKTLELVRFASKFMECVVSWNHLIDHYMALGRPSQALKLYNEMKKRAQKPDSYTYMIVLRGLGNNAHMSHSVGHALAVFHSMSAPNSRIPPSTMHANAVLRVCTRANDMDALWGIASKLPESGPGAADAQTYTTILQAIRQESLLSPMGMSADEIARKREAAIIDGRRIWEDVVNKWRAGNIIIDEELVCAMGQLLLIGQRPRDWDDVLSLFEQTMDIPRLIGILGTGQRQPFIKAPGSPRDMKREDFAPVDPTDELRRGGEFDPIKPEKAVGGGRRKMAYAKPGNHSLSLIIDSCLKMTAKKTGEDYWNLLTASDSYGIVPDESNLHMYLRTLRNARASAAAVAFIRTEFGSAGLQPKAKTFRISMSTCVRDKNNPNVFDNANAILDLMASTLRDPDTKTLAMYTDVLSSLPRAEQILDGLDRLGPQFVNVKSMLNYGRNDGASGVNKEDEGAALKFMSGMKSCYDRLINDRAVMRERSQELTIRKAKIDAYVARLWRKRKMREGVDVRDPERNPGRRTELDNKQEQTGEESGGGGKDYMAAQRKSKWSAPRHERR